LAIFVEKPTYIALFGRYLRFLCPFPRLKLLKTGPGRRRQMASNAPPGAIYHIAMPIIKLARKSITGQRALFGCRVRSCQGCCQVQLARKSIARLPALSVCSLPYLPYVGGPKSQGQKVAGSGGSLFAQKFKTWYDRYGRYGRQE